MDSKLYKNNGDVWCWNIDVCGEFPHSARYILSSHTEIYDKPRYESTVCYLICLRAQIATQAGGRIMLTKAFSNVPPTQISWTRFGSTMIKLREETSKFNGKKMSAELEMRIRIPRIKIGKIWTKVIKMSSHTCRAKPKLRISHTVSRNPNLFQRRRRWTPPSW